MWITGAPNPAFVANQLSVLNLGTLRSAASSHHPGEVHVEGGGLMSESQVGMVGGASISAPRKAPADRCQGPAKAGMINQYSPPPMIDG